MTTTTAAHKADAIIGSERSSGPDRAMRAECKCGRVVVLVVNGEWDGEKAASYWRHSK